MITFARETVHALASKLNLDPESVATAIVAGWTATYRTATAIIAGVGLDAYANGARDPESFLGYLRVHWLAWVVVNIILPTWRAASTYRDTQAASVPPTPAASSPQKAD